MKSDDADDELTAEIREAEHEIENGHGAPGSRAVN
jgi:hypothetical protein